ncbi:MAG: hypothetical protein KKG09_02550 [Verrucomicrobia bacterium]|nr:hypothetical protein [Verrucomicrobiota bacterium]MCG2679271.1 hypothetical protein [Kiritimatiellia bacterium]MBU4247753.1 hypothetical protein [Verrucomicrobiota bacterium]MBU4290960.1 hypothetical protein [Verrucomicrobiota bacterium]MBU4430295.1 hypothetical protein [Verrucomicrobiota bacterium]
MNKTINIILLLQASVFFNVEFCKNLHAEQYQDRILQGIPVNNSEEIDTEIIQAVKGKFNILAVPAFTRGGTYYKSNVINSWNGVKDDFEPFNYLVTSARKNSIRVYAILGVYYWGGKIFKEVPAAMLFNSGKSSVATPCPANPKTNKLIINIAEEVIAKFKADGIVIDMLTLHGERDCVCELCIQEFDKIANTNLANVLKGIDGYARVGKAIPSDSPLVQLREKYSALRSEQKERLLTELIAACKRTGPNIPVITIINERDINLHYNLVKKGVIDRVLIMDYNYGLKGDGAYQSFQSQAQRQAKLFSDIQKSKLIIGACSYSDVIERGKRLPKPPADLQREIELVRSLGYPISLYYSGETTDAQLNMLSAIFSAATDAKSTAKQDNSRR